MEYHYGIVIKGDLALFGKTEDLSAEIAKARRIGTPTELLVSIGTSNALKFALAGLYRNEDLSFICTPEAARKLVGDCLPLIIGPETRNPTLRLTAPGGGMSDPVVAAAIEKVLSKGGLTEGVICNKVRRADKAQIRRALAKMDLAVEERAHPINGKIHRIYSLKDC